MRLYERYAIKRGDDLGDPAFWNGRLEDLDNRLHARELDGEKVDGAVEQLISLGLQRLNDTVTPVIDAVLEQLESVGARFEAESLTENTVGLGEFTFVITPGTRAAWVVTDYVAIQSTLDPENGFVGSVVSYDRASGILVVDVSAAVGEGAFSSWKMRVSAPPDLEHATRTDNPHLTTAAQVGAMTIAQTEDAIADAVAALNAVIAGKADLAHTHAQADITGLTAALAGKEAADTDILKGDVSVDLGVGYRSTSKDQGSKSGGTFMLDMAIGNIQHFANDGAFTLAPPTGHGTIVLDQTNGATAGAITRSGFTKVTGDTVDTVNGNKFRHFISVGNGGSHCHSQKMF